MNKKMDAYCLQLSLFPFPTTKLAGVNMAAVEINSKVKHNYGPEKFVVVHSGGIIEEWSAMNRQHLDLLLRIEKNLGYMQRIDLIINEKPIVK